MCSCKGPSFSMMTGKLAKYEAAREAYQGVDITTVCTLVRMADASARASGSPMASTDLAPLESKGNPTMKRKPSATQSMSRTSAAELASIMMASWSSKCFASSVHKSFTFCACGSPSKTIVSKFSSTKVVWKHANLQARTRGKSLS